jgi:hypothetical protein
MACVTNAFPEYDLLQDAVFVLLIVSREPIAVVPPAALLMVIEPPPPIVIVSPPPRDIVPPSVRADTRALKLVAADDSLAPPKNKTAKKRIRDRIRVYFIFFLILFVLTYFRY